MSSFLKSKEPQAPKRVGLLYFLLVVFPYAMMLAAIFGYTRYSVLEQYVIATIFAIAWYGLANKWFIKKLGDPYEKSLKSSLMKLVQFLMAVVVSNILLIWLT